MLYAILILGSMAVISIVNIFAVAPLYDYSLLQIILWTCISTVCVIIIDGIMATIVRRLMPEKWFKGLFKGYIAGKRECRFYELIGIKKWKDKVLELGGFTNLNKSKIEDPTNNDYVLRYITEANYGVICHVAGIIFGFGAIFCCPKNLWLTIGLPVSIVSAVLSALPTFILRYNLPKLHRLYALNQRRTKKQ
ncbi:MAG: hypothetical protein IJA97_05355 [Clostridia bacterium]|nr:hypothetical protein [Clostridia bacterium]